MSTQFRGGDRVRISAEYHWAGDATGRVAAGAPEWPRTVQGVERQITFYLIEFDAPQLDADGDGPYTSAEIDERYLQCLEISPPAS